MGGGVLVCRGGRGNSSWPGVSSKRVTLLMKFQQERSTLLKGTNMSAQQLVLHMKRKPCRIIHVYNVISH